MPVTQSRDDYWIIQPKGQFYTARLNLEKRVGAGGRRVFARRWVQVWMKFVRFLLASGRTPKEVLQKAF